MQELVGRRTRYAKVYDLGEGQRRAVISAGVVHYQDERGTWRDVETAVAVDDALANNPYLRLGAELMVRLPRTLRGVATVNDRRGHTLAYKALDAALVTGVVDGASVRYPEAWPGTALEYIVTPEGLKTLLHRDPATAPTVYRWRVTGSVMAIPDGGAIRWGDGLETQAMLTPPAWATDAGGERVAVSQALEGDVLTISCDPSATVVDPTTTIQPSSADSGVHSNDPSWPPGSSDELHVDSVSWTLIRFDLSAVVAATINSAIMELYQFLVFGGAVDVLLNRITNAWQESTVTWNSKPAYDTSTTYTASKDVTVNTWHSLDITPIVADWLSDTAPNYGVQLRPAVVSSGGQYYRSREASPATYRPKLTIDYTEGSPGGGGSTRRRFGSII